MGLIDSHVHAFARSQVRDRQALCDRDAAFAEMYADPHAKMSTADETIGALRSAGFAGALVSGFAFGADGDCREQNGEVGRAMVDGFRFLASVNPAAAGWMETAREALDLGAVGFGELRPGNQGWDPLGTEARQLYGLCLDAGAVVLWHASEPVGHAYPGKGGGINPAELCAVASGWPGLRQVAAHLGGGLPFFLLMPEVRGILSNTWFDTAASSLLYDDAAVTHVVSLAGSRRVLFGSDYPLLSPRRHVERISRALNPEDVEAICGGNVQELLGGSGKG